MTFQKAYEQIEQDFHQSKDILKEAHSKQSSYYIQRLEALGKNYSFNKVFDEIIHRFLFAGLVKFDRWFAPSPVVVKSDYHKHFDRFFSLFTSHNPRDFENNAVFHIHGILYDFFDAFDQKALSSISSADLKGYLSELNNIVSPQIPMKKKEFEDQKENAVSIVNGALDGSLRTLIKTTLPFIVYSQPLKLDTNWRGLPVSVFLKPFFLAQLGMINSPGGSVQTANASKWSSGNTQVEIEFHALLDPKKWVKSPLPIDKSIALNADLDGWPAVFEHSFSLLYDIIWYLREKDGSESQWLLSPSDIFQVEWCFKTSSKTNIFVTTSTSPVQMIKVLNPSEETLQMNIAKLLGISWYKKCKILAKLYFSLGETNESLFWANVGVEAFFEYKVKEITTKKNLQEVYNELNSPKAIWDQANEIVISQFPELKDKIKWPNINAHINQYSKLKYFYKKVSMKVPLNSILKHYSRITQKRNKLFHGAHHELVDREIIENALTSLDWIIENFDSN